ERLFGEERCIADERLFADSLARARPRRPRRPARLQKQASPAEPAWVQGTLDLFGERPGAEDEPLRGHGPGALGAVAPPAVRGDRGPGQLFLGFGEPGVGEDRGAGQRVRRGHAAGRGVPGPGGEARPGSPAGRGDRPARDDPAGAGAGSGRARPGGVAPFRPAGQEDLAPSGAVSRVRANLAALAVLRTLQHDAQPPAAEEQAALARWSGWG